MPRQRLPESQELYRMHIKQLETFLQMRKQEVQSLTHWIGMLAFCNALLFVVLLWSLK